MTENEIIKGLNFCGILNKIEFCDKCPANTFGFSCGNELSKQALDLINRQTAEIERLKKEASILSINADTAFQEGLNEAQDLYAEQIREKIKSEAIKEFVSALKNRVVRKFEYTDIRIFNEIDSLVKEMTEGIK